MNLDVLRTPKITLALSVSRPYRGVSCPRSPRNRWIGVIFLLVVSSKAVLANEKLLGRWEGALGCDADHNLRMALSIKEVRNGQLRGVFEFWAGGQHASYNVVGTVSSTGAFQLDPASWINQPSGFRASGLRGEIFRIGSMDGMKGTLPQCKEGYFSAYLQAPVEAPPPPLAGESGSPEWTKAVRDRVQEFVAKREDNQFWWNILENEIIFGRLDEASRKSLLPNFSKPGRISEPMLFWMNWRPARKNSPRG